MKFGTEMVAKALAMQEDWCTWRDCESNDMLTAENQAIARILRDWEQLPAITGGALEVDGTLAAYTIAELLPDQTPPWSSILKRAARSTRAPIRPSTGCF